MTFILQNQVRRFRVRIESNAIITRKRPLALRTSKKTTCSGTAEVLTCFEIGEVGGKNRANKITLRENRFAKNAIKTTTTTTSKRAKKIYFAKRYFTVSHTIERIIFIVELVKTESNAIILFSANKSIKIFFYI